LIYLIFTPTSTQNADTQLLVKSDPSTPDYPCGNSDPDGHPAVPTILDSSLSTCGAIAKCAQLTYADKDIYASFNLRFLISEHQWLCYQNWDHYYIGAQCFTTADPDVGESYGYDFS
jgi:hypothetical protein